MVHVAGGTIVDFAFHVSSGFIYWADFGNMLLQPRSLARKLNVHRIKPDGSDYADVISVSAVSSSSFLHLSDIRNISALAINWAEGMVSKIAEFRKWKVSFLIITSGYNIMTVVVAVLLLVMVVMLLLIIAAIYCHYYYCTKFLMLSARICDVFCD